MADFDDWTIYHVIMAAAQGWCISETQCRGAAPLEIQRLDDADTVGILYGVTIPQLRDDRDAAEALRKAYISREDHAILAVSIIRRQSPKEYEHWRMMEWNSNT